MVTSFLRGRAARTLLAIRDGAIAMAVVSGIGLIATAEDAIVTWIAALLNLLVWVTVALDAHRQHRTLN
jgi:hypothetical protein